MLIQSIQWGHPSTNLIAGPSNSGRTSISDKIFHHKNTLFTQSGLKTILFYNVWTGGLSVIFDDLGGEIMKNLNFFEHIFVVLSHHLKITIFFSYSQPF